MKPDLRHVLRLPGGLEMAFRLIPAGSFRMGSRDYYSAEEPLNRVRIPEPFWLAETPVTQAQFGVWTRMERIQHENHFKDRPDHPAENMDWREAVRFCEWLTQVRAGKLPEGFGLACLPTEAAWEYACRARTDTEYYTGDGEAALAEAGWFYGNAENSTHPVGLKEPNAFGLHDMHGNVWEWCRDVWDRHAYRKRPDGWEGREWTFGDAGNDAETWESGKATPENATRVLRGGSWDVSAGFCRSAYRYWLGPDDRYWNFGFRVCLVPGPSAAGPARAQPTPGDGGRGTRPESDGAGGARLDDLASATLPRVAGRNKKRKPHGP